METMNRNYDSISPSARSILLLKGHTNIPFARKTAELLAFPEKYDPDFNKRDVGFWARVVHFERRYWSLDQLLSGLPIHHILELSSGFSFRGLAITKQPGFHYIDTDLPDVISTKKQFIKTLHPEPINADSRLEILPLNALDEGHFEEIVNRFPAGEIAIVNEGLLMYLSLPEKEKLCSIIHKVLKQRGGYWITADIYLKNKIRNPEITISARERLFFQQHQVEEKKFDSFEAAAAFFEKMGFVIDEEAELDYSKLSTLQYFLKSATPEQLEKMKSTGKIHETWRLRVAD